MKRQSQSESEHAASEQARLAEQENPSLDPATVCGRCYGSGRESVLVDGYVESRVCDHRILPPLEDVPF